VAIKKSLDKSIVLECYYIPVHKFNVLHYNITKINKLITIESIVLKYILNNANAICLLSFVINVVYSFTFTEFFSFVLSGDSSRGRHGFFCIK